MWTDAVAGHSPAAASFIATNNIKVALMAYAFGATAGLGTLFVLITNGMSIGATFAVCQVHGMADRLGAFVAPHGVFELSAIYISGGAGLMMAKGILFPGQLRRTDSMKQMAKEGSLLALGCIPLLLIAGAIEGYVSPRTDISLEYKLAVSIATAIVLLFYLFAPRTAGSKKKSNQAQDLAA